MTEFYPSALPGVLINSNSYTVQDLVRKTDLQSGPPIFRLDADNGWVLFDVTWSFSDLEKQIFDNWHRWTLRNGSRAFTIELWTDGFDGTDNTKEHTCHFTGPPRMQQVGRRWSVSAQLLALEQITLDEDTGLSLVALSESFPDGIYDTIVDINSLIVLMEDEWPV